MRGFSIVELVIALVILSVLSITIIMAVQKSIISSDAARNLLENFLSAQIDYYQKTGTFENCPSVSEPNPCGINPVQKCVTPPAGLREYFHDTSLPEIVYVCNSGTGYIEVAVTVNQNISTYVKKTLVVPFSGDYKVRVGNNVYTDGT